MLAPCIRKHFAGPGLAGTRGVYGGIEGNLRLGELPQSPPWHCRGFHGFNSWIENRSLISLPRRQLGVKVGGSRAGASQFLKPESGGRGLSRKVQARASGEMVGVDVKVPKAKKVPHVTEMFGHVRENNYYWLRDDSRKEPEILEYLKSENDYTEAMTADTKAFQEELYKEMRGRIQEADTSVPLRKGAFFYYKRDLEGKQYPQHCRRATPDGERPGSVEEVMESGDGAAVETVLLDENAVAEKHSFYLVGTVKVLVSSLQQSGYSPWVFVPAVDLIFVPSTTNFDNILFLAPGSWIHGAAHFQEGQTPVCGRFFVVEIPRIVTLNMSFAN